MGEISLVCDKSLYLKAKWWFPKREINMEKIPPFSEEYFELMADVRYMEDYHARIHGLDVK